MTRVRPYPLTPLREVPASVPRPEYVGQPAAARYKGSNVQSAEVIEKMRIAGKIASQAMYETATHIAPGVTTDQLDAVAHEFLMDHQAYPSALLYPGHGGGQPFPKGICTSVNEVVCHGIPDTRPLDDGDLVKIDITAFKNGVHGDNCGTFGCGDLDEDSQLLLERTKTALERAIKAVVPGREINVIGRVIEAYAGRFGYGIVRDYTGHGVHTAFHSGLVILHYDEPSHDLVIEPGMTFTIEPMLTLGKGDCHRWDDDWTVATNDGSRVAQWEHTLVVTQTGTEVLTLP